MVYEDLDPWADDVEAADALPASSWRPVTLGDVIDGLRAGTLTRPKPTIGHIQGGGCLFYPGRVNGLAGESNAGKTWTALAACAQELAAGNAVIYVDLEDDAAGIVGRLLDLGADPDAIRDRFGYINPVERFDVAAREDLAAVIDALRPTAVVIDSTGEALALHGANPNADEDVATWFRVMPRWIADRGPGVLVLDHVTKADDAGLWPIGSQRKRAAITGAQYMQRVVRPFAKGAAGHAKLVCAKDRSGNYRAGQHVADLNVSPTGNGVHVELIAAVEREQTSAGTFRPTGFMERISRAVEASPEPLTFNGICERVTGKRTHLRAAVDALTAEGFLSARPGPRSGVLHSSVKPFREAGEPVEPGAGPATGSTGSGSLDGEPGTSDMTGSRNRSGTSGNQCPDCLPDGRLCLQHWKAATS